MDNVRGLRTRLCPKCGEITPHRTLYAKTESGGRSRWFQLFWACTKCNSLNHVLLPRHRLERASSPLPSALAVAVVKALEERPLDIDELIMSLRQRRVPEVRHVFNSEVAMAIEFLKGRGVVAEETRDCTERVLESLRVRSVGSKHLGACPAESNLGVPRRALVSLYAQRQTGAAHGMRLVPAGVLCLHCQYHRIDA
ncbi:MAG: hypothetical protein JRM82_03240 [Nitrososphaerota archaeon]|nr:hypothetical protein [Nitrososphaerota archaeon]